MSAATPTTSKDRISWRGEIPAFFVGRPFESKRLHKNPFLSSLGTESWVTWADRPTAAHVAVKTFEDIADLLEAPCKASKFPFVKPRRGTHEEKLNFGQLRPLY